MITIINENNKIIHVNKTLDVSFVSKNISFEESKVKIDDIFLINLLPENDNLFFIFDSTNLFSISIFTHTEYPLVKNDIGLDVLLYFNLSNLKHFL